MKKARVYGSFLLVGVLSGCANLDRKVELPPKLPADVIAQEAGASKEKEPDFNNKEQKSTVIKQTPKVTSSGSSTGGSAIEQVDTGAATYTFNVENMPVVVFINKVYGEFLGKTFAVADDVAKKKNLVTLRTDGKKTAKEIETIANTILQTYGITAEETNGVLRFISGDTQLSTKLPFVINDRTLPDMPLGTRPIFQMVPVQFASSGDITSWLRQAFQGQNLQAYDHGASNSLILLGNPTVVRSALEAVEIFDQPIMRGKHSLRIDPAYWSSEKLAERLKNILKSEGYHASLNADYGSAVLIPVPEVNTILAFSSDRKLLNHIAAWAKELDKPSSSPAGEGIFIYQVKNTDAKILSETLEPLLEQSTANAGDKGSKGSSKKSGSKKKSSQLVVSEARNAIIFAGTSEDWRRLKPVLYELDKPPRLVMVDVTIAEVTLDENQEFGVEWTSNFSLGDHTGSIGTLGGLGKTSTKGLSFAISKAGVPKVNINASQDDTNLTILSNPKIMVQSGRTASIEVGDEVPIVTSRKENGNNPDQDNNLTQEIQYKKTGILLTVKPLVHGSGQVDLDILQEVSEAKDASTSGVQSPTIQNRRLETSLSLNSGSTVLLGGLVSRSTSDSKNGVPVLSDLPGIGWLFSKEKITDKRTELILMITPYIIESSAQAESITKAFRASLAITNTYNKND